MTQYPNRPAGPADAGAPPPSAADTEDTLLAALALDLQAAREREPQLLRHIDVLHARLAERDEALLRCRAELAQARQAAASDALTGLPNRRGFEPPLHRELTEHADRAQVLALLFVDIDGFKAINDRLGHAAGDQLLRIVGARLVAGMRRRDLVCRHGGDEFVCLLPHLRSPARAGALAATLLRSITQPCVIDGHEVRLQASIGVAIYPRDGDNAPTLLRSADAAMYAAKSRHGGVAMAQPLVAAH